MIVDGDNVVSSIGPALSTILAILAHTPAGRRSNKEWMIKNGPGMVKPKPGPNGTTYPRKSRSSLKKPWDRPHKQVNGIAVTVGIPWKPMPITADRPPLKQHVNNGVTEFNTRKLIQRGADAIYVQAENPAGRVGRRNWFETATK